MKATKFAALVTMMTGAILAMPGESRAQEATVQASVTVVAPERVPEVTVVAEWVDGRQQPSVVISGEGRLRVVALKVGAEDRALVDDVPGRRLAGPVGGSWVGEEVRWDVPVSIVLAAI